MALFRERSHQKDAVKKSENKEEQFSVKQIHDAVSQFAFYFRKEMFKK